VGFSFSWSFLVAGFELAAVDLLLGADNAILIALACSVLPAPRRPRALAYAIAAAIVLRFALATVAGLLLAYPFVRLVSGLLLISIAIGLLAETHGGVDEHADLDAASPADAIDDRFWRAVMMITLADAVMSLDNVLALASIAQGNLPLLAFGILMGIPALGFGAYVVTRILDRYPALVVGGSMLLGWIAGQMAISDTLYAHWIEQQAPALPYVAPLLCAIYVAQAGLSARRKRLRAARSKA
jgi:YjbE family integral membrane protein